MLADRKEKIRFISSCILTCIFTLFSFLMANMAWETIIFENYMPSEGMSAFFGVLYGTLVYITVPLFGMGILSVGLLAAFFAYSLRSHENRKIGIFMKTCCIFNACFIVLDILSLIIVLL